MTATYPPKNGCGGIIKRYSKIKRLLLRHTLVINVFCKTLVRIYIENYCKCMQNGGDVTLKALRALHKTSPAVVEKLFLFLRDAPLYEQIRVNNRNYILVHSGLANYASNRDIEDYTRAELLWAEPEITDRYSQSFITIFGHTPTLALKPESEGKILYTDTWFDIDVGIPYGNPPVLLRLEDHQEFR